MPTVRSEQIQDATLTRTQMAASAFYLPLTPVNTTPYSVVDADELILVDSSLGTIQVDLQALAGVTDGRRIIIKDAFGYASINAITVAPNGAEMIDGGFVRTLSTNYEVLTLVKTSIQWITV